MSEQNIVIEIVDCIKVEQFDEAISTFAKYQKEHSKEEFKKLFDQVHSIAGKELMGKLTSRLLNGKKQ